MLCALLRWLEPLPNFLTDSLLKDPVCIGKIWFCSTHIFQINVFHPYIYSFTYPFIHSSIYPFIYSASTHSFIYPFIWLLIHLPIYSLNKHLSPCFMLDTTVKLLPPFLILFHPFLSFFSLLFYWNHWIHLKNLILFYYHHQCM